MKRIEEIERLGAEELERIASGSGVKIPDGLEGKIEDALTAATLAACAPKKRMWKFAIAPAAIAVLAAVTVGLNYRNLNATPSDTFDNPQEAYAELEKAFGLISDKMNRSRELADAILPEINRALEMPYKSDEK